MRDADRKASRSPTSDLNEFNRKTIEKNMAGIRAVPGTPDDTRNSISSSDISKAQERFAQKLEQKNQAPIRYRQNNQKEGESGQEPPSSRSPEYERLSQREYSNGTPRNGKIKRQPPDSKISYTAAFFLVGTALLIDTMQFLVGIIPILGQIMGVIFTFIATFTFWLWFKLLGVSFDRKQSLSFMGGSIIEFIPVLGMLPTWTLVIVTVILRQEFNSKLPPILKK
jgi:hypothetical protein